jgi:NADH-quinone oxidoreductase subunit M
MTVFIGGWEKDDAFHRTATVVACASIVVTAVYILRAVGQVAMGPLAPSGEGVSDAKWQERWAVLILVAGILAMGLLPGWLNDLVGPGVERITNK